MQAAERTGREPGARWGGRDGREGTGAGGRRPRGGHDENGAPVRIVAACPLPSGGDGLSALRDGAALVASGVGQGDPVSERTRARHEPGLSLRQLHVRVWAHGVPFGPRRSAAGPRTRLWAGRVGADRVSALQRASHARGDLAPTARGARGRHLAAARPASARGLSGALARERSRPGGAARAARARTRGIDPVAGRVAAGARQRAALGRARGPQRGNRGGDAPATGQCAVPGARVAAGPDHGAASAGGDQRCAGVGAPGGGRGLPGGAPPAVPVSCAARGHRARRGGRPPPARPGQAGGARPARGRGAHAPAGGRAPGDRRRPRPGRRRGVGHGAGPAPGGARTRHPAVGLRGAACPRPADGARRHVGSPSGQNGEPSLARLRTLVARAVAAGGQSATDLRRIHVWLLDLTHCLDPDTSAPRSGAIVRREVERLLEALPTRFPAGQVPTWLEEKAAYVGTVLRRLGDGLYHCYDVPGLPRTDNALEQFYRQLKADERRAIGHRRSDAFVVRVGGFAAYAAAASTPSEHDLPAQLATVPTTACQASRVALRATQERQTPMHRFHLRPDRYLSDLEARWTKLAADP